MREKNAIFKLVKYENLGVYVDADFAGNWDPKEYTDCDTAISRHIYLIKYGGCTILWKSQLQIEVALSST